MTDDANGADAPRPAMEFGCHDRCRDRYARRLREMHEWSPLDFAALLDRIGNPDAAGEVNKAAYAASVWIAQSHAASDDADDREEAIAVLAATSALDDGEDFRGPIPAEGEEHEERVARLADYEAARAHLLGA